MVPRLVTIWKISTTYSTKDNDWVRWRRRRKVDCLRVKQVYPWKWSLLDTDSIYLVRKIRVGKTFINQTTTRPLDQVDVYLCGPLLKKRTDFSVSTRFSFLNWKRGRKKDLIPRPRTLRRLQNTVLVFQVPTFHFYFYLSGTKEPP